MPRLAATAVPRLAGLLTSLMRGSRAHDCLEHLVATIAVVDENQFEVGKIL